MGLAFGLCGPGLVNLIVMWCWCLWCGRVLLLCGLHQTRLWCCLLTGDVYTCCRSLLLPVICHLSFVKSNTFYILLYTNKQIKQVNIQNYINIPGLIEVEPQHDTWHQK